MVDVSIGTNVVQGCLAETGYTPKAGYTPKVDRDDIDDENVVSTYEGSESDDEDKVVESTKKLTERKVSTKRVTSKFGGSVSSYSESRQSLSKPGQVEQVDLTDDLPTLPNPPPQIIVPPTASVTMDSGKTSAVVDKVPIPSDVKLPDPELAKIPGGTAIPDKDKIPCAPIIPSHAKIPSDTMKTNVVKISELRNWVPDIGKIPNVTIDPVKIPDEIKTDKITNTTTDPVKIPDGIKTGQIPDAPMDPVKIPDGIKAGKIPDAPLDPVKIPDGIKTGKIPDAPMDLVNTKIPDGSIITGTAKIPCDTKVTDVIAVPGTPVKLDSTEGQSTTASPSETTTPGEPVDSGVVEYAPESGKGLAGWLSPMDQVESDWDELKNIDNLTFSDKYDFIEDVKLRGGLTDVQKNDWVKMIVKYEQEPLKQT